MKQRISSCSSTIAISFLLILFAGLPIAAQQPHPNPTPKRNQVKKKEVPKDTIPLYNGTYVSLDLYGLGSNLLGGDYLSSEVSASVNLKNKYIPTIELGYGKTDTWGETGVRYKTGAPYFRIGMDYNTMANKKDKSSFLYAGIRYGFTSFKYDVMDALVYDPMWGDYINPALSDHIWGGSMNFDHTGMKATLHWVELVGGVNVQIYKNFHMGWSVRFKFKAASSISEYGDPWYVPGYGKFGSTTLGLTYSLIYKLPL